MNPTCPSCKSKANFYFSFQNYLIYRCPACTLEFIHPFPSKSEIKKTYSKSYFQGKLSGVKGYKNYRALEKELLEEAEKRLRYIQNFTQMEKILDVGTGSGLFLRVAKQKGYQVSGNDISPFSLIEFKKNGLSFYYGAIKRETFGDDQFEIITAWDVIEHLDNVKNAVVVLQSLLKKGGYLFLTTPDTDSFDARFLGRRWYGYKKIPEHLVFFNKKSVIKLLEDNGFKVIKVAPWGFIRNLGFVSEKIASYFPALRLFNKAPVLKKLATVKLFFPFTDFIVVAQKVAANGANNKFSKD